MLPGSELGLHGNDMLLDAAGWARASTATIRRLNAARAEYDSANSAYVIILATATAEKYQQASTATHNGRWKSR